MAGNCVGGSSVVYFAASLRAPSFVFDRQGSTGPPAVAVVASPGASLDPWYDRVEHTLPVAQQSWDDVPYPGGLFAAACHHAGHTCNPVPVAVDLAECTNCNWMLNGCRFGAKRSMLLNYLPAAQAHGAQIRPLHEVQLISKAVTPGYRYQVAYTAVDAERLPPAGRRRRHRGQDPRARRRHDGHTGDPAPLGAHPGRRAAARSAGTSRPTATGCPWR